MRHGQFLKKFELRFPSRLAVIPRLESSVYLVIYRSLRKNWWIQTFPKCIKTDICHSLPQDRTWHKVNDPKVMKTPSSKVWTLFPISISKNDNHYTTGASALNNFQGLICHKTQATRTPFLLANKNQWRPFFLSPTFYPSSFPIPTRTFHFKLFLCVNLRNVSLPNSLTKKSKI